MLLQQTLRSLCGKSGWCYAVLWKLKRRNRMVLTWEDAYCEHSAAAAAAIVDTGRNPLDQASNSAVPPAHHQIGLAVAKMSYHVYSLGEGIIGRVAFTQKHQWVFGRPEGKSMLDKYPAGWANQFAAGIQTIAVISVSQGVVQLGSTQRIMEDLSLVLHIRSLFCTLQGVPGAIFSDLVFENAQEERQKQDYRHMTPMQAFPTAASPNLPQPLFASQRPFLFTYPIPTPQFSGNFVSNVPGVVPSNSWDITGQARNYLQSGIQSGNFQTMKSVNRHAEVGHGGASSSSKASHFQGDYNPLESVLFSAGQSSSRVVATFATEDSGFLGEGHGRPPGLANSRDISYPLSVTNSDVDLDSLLIPTDAFEECSFGSLMPALGEGIDRFFSLLPKDHSEDTPSITSTATSSIETQVTEDNKFGNLTVVQPREQPQEHQQAAVRVACSEVSTVLEPVVLNTDGIRGVKRTRPRDLSRPRPRDRQQIQDRVKELREIVPDAAKCSIDMLLEKTIKHMKFLQSVMQHSGKWSKQDTEIRNGASWVIKMDGGSNSQDRCPIFVKDLIEAGQMLVEAICQEKELFLEMAANIRSLGLVILKGVMETRNGNVWGRFVVEASQDVRRFDVMCSLVRLLQRNTDTDHDMI